MLEDYAETYIKKNKNMMVPYYIMASYAYYVDDDPIFSDSYYDELAKRILKHWDEINHYHKYILSKDALEAGSFLGDYPSIIEGALKSLRQQTNKKRRKK